ncbi:hypothetical protein MEK_00417 [Candida albicans 12C]|nr:hypothetical protein MEK_00417 [Candida albicans 12C]
MRIDGTCFQIEDPETTRYRLVLINKLYYLCDKSYKVILMIN